MEQALIRTEMVLGRETMERLASCRVAVFGIGGVGGYVAEALARSGVGTLELIDNDRVNPSNLNRQILALHSTLGMYKVDAAAARIRDINPAITVRTSKAFYLPETREHFDFSGYDYVADCIDTVTGKLDLVLQCRAAGTPIISAMGTGNKLDPSLLQVADIYETAVCPLARIMRKELRRRGVERLQVVYSREEPQPLKAAPPEEPAPEPGSPAEYGSKRRSIPGSTAFVPAAAGLLMASVIVRELTGTAARSGA